MTDNLWDVKSTLYRWFRNKFPFRQILNQENINLEALLDSVKLESKKIIDIGTGTGNVLQYLGNTGIIIGIDASFAMLRNVRYLFPHVHLMQADALSLPLKPSTADVVTAVGLVEYLKDVEPFFFHAALALKNNGYLVITFSPKGLCTSLRLLLGHSIFSNKLDEIVAIAQSHNLIKIHNCSSLMQGQVLFQKM